NLELHLLALAQVLELGPSCEPRAVEEHVLRPVVGGDEAEPLVAHDALDGTGHRARLYARRAHLASRAPHFPSEAGSTDSAVGLALAIRAAAVQRGRGRRRRDFRRPARARGPAGGRRSLRPRAWPRTQERRRRLRPRPPQSGLVNSSAATPARARRRS